MGRNCRWARRKAGRVLSGTRRPSGPLDGEVAARHPDRVARPDVDRDVEKQPLRVVALREVVLHGDHLQAFAGVLDDVSSRTLYLMGFVDRRPRRRAFGGEWWCGEQNGGEHEGDCDERGTHAVTSNPGAASISIVAEFMCDGRPEPRGGRFSGPAVGAAGRRGRLQGWLGGKGSREAAVFRASGRSRRAARTAAGLVGRKGEPRGDRFRAMVPPTVPVDIDLCLALSLDVEKRAHRLASGRTRLRGRWGRARPLRLAGGRRCTLRPGRRHACGGCGGVAPGRVRGGARPSRRLAGGAGLPCPPRGARHGGRRAGAAVGSGPRRERTPARRAHWCALRPCVGRAFASGAS